MRRFHSMLLSGAALSLVLAVGGGTMNDAVAAMDDAAAMESAITAVTDLRERVEAARIDLERAQAEGGDVEAAEAELAAAEAALAEAEAEVAAQEAAAEEAAAEEAAAEEAAAEEAAAEEAAAEEAAAEEAAAEEAATEEAAAEEAAAEEAAAEEAAAEEAAAEEAATEEAAAEEAATEEAATEEAAIEEAAAEEAAAEEAAAEEAATEEAAAEEAATEEAAAEEAAAEEAAAEEAAAEEAATEEAAAEEAAAEEAATEEAAAEEAAAEEAEEAEAEAAAARSAETLSEEELEQAQQESIERAVEEALARQAEEAAAAEETGESEEEQDSDRDELIRMLGIGAAGWAVGALIPELGGRLITQDDDRVVIQQDDRLIVRKDETERLLTDGSTVSVEELAEGRSRVTVTYPDGIEVITLRDAGGNPVRRVRRLPNGDEVVLFDERDTDVSVETIDEDLPWLRREERVSQSLSQSSQADIRSLLTAPPIRDHEQAYSLRQIRENERLRWLAPSLELDTVTFATNSAELGASEVRALDEIGQTLADLIDRNPDEVFLIEGHTDAVGPDLYNLTLSDRRADTVASLLTEFYEVPPENLITQGYGEQDLVVPTLGPSRENRRVAVRRITELLR